MSIDSIASTMIGMDQSRKSGALQAVFINQQKQQDQALVGMLEKSIADTPAPKAAGTGLVVDKTA